MARPLHAGDVIRLINPGYGEPVGDCMVIANQIGVLVWFRATEPTAPDRGPCFVARRAEVKVIRRQHSTEEPRS